MRKLLPIFGTLDVSFPFSASHISPPSTCFQRVSACADKGQGLERRASLVEYCPFPHPYPIHFLLQVYSYRFITNVGSHSLSLKKLPLGAGIRHGDCLSLR